MELHLFKRSLVLLLILLVSAQTQEHFFEETIVLPTDSTTSFPFQNLTYRTPKSLKVALVLSGGGARGITHLGVLKALEDNNVPIDLIVGSSIGSAVGGFYAAGYSSDELIKVFKDVDWDDLFANESNRTNLFWSQKSDPRKHFLELRFDRGVPYIPSSLTTGQKVFDMIYSRLLYANFQSANDFDNLKIPFRAVATDLVSGQRVVLEKGDLAEAISGSMAIPLLFSPVELDDMWLVDGGITDNLPVDVALANDADLVIAVDATSPLRTTEEMKLPWQLADQVTTIMMKNPTLQSRELANVVIAPELDNWSSAEFFDLDSLIGQGYAATAEKISEIKKLLEIYRENLWGENTYLGKVSEINVQGIKSEPLIIVAEKLAVPADNRLYIYDVYKNLAEFYGTGLVKKAYATIQGNSSNLRLTYHIEENPHVNGIRVITNLQMGDSLWNQWARSYEKGTINFNRLMREINEILNHYYDSGKSLAHILAIKYDNTNQELLIFIDEGLIDQIQISGNMKTKDFILSRELEFSEGDIFLADNAIRSLQNIYSTGLFNRVTLNVLRGDSANTIIIRVKEKRYVLMRVGLNASIERQANAFVEFAQDNLFGREVKLSLMGMIGNLEKSAEFKIYSVRLFKTLLTYRFSLYYSDRLDRYFEENTKLDDYLTIRRGVQFVLGQQIARLGSITGEVRWDNVHVFSDDPAFPYGDKYRIRAIAVRSIVDKRDKLPFPDRGIYNRWFWESGIKSILLGGNTSFTRFYISLEGYYPLLSSLVFHIRASGGVGDNTVPFSEFFTLGGMDDFPGLYQKEMIGRQIFSWNNELRYRVPWDVPLELYVGGSVNVGSTWENTEDPISFSDLLISYGAYVAFNSLFGPIKLAYGHLPNVRDLIYFSIGYNF